jgi:hypothetical protein
MLVSEFNLQELDLNANCISSWHMFFWGSTRDQHMVL